MLNDLVADLERDFRDEEGIPFAPVEYLERCTVRALPLVAEDLNLAYRLNGDIVTPDMPGHHRELWLLQAKIMLCRLMRTQAATRIAFSSGDKKMDRSREAANWAALEKDLRRDYASTVKRINPMADDSLLVLDACAAVYKHGASAGKKERRS